MIFDNRTGDQLWEKGYVQKYFCIIFLGFGCPAVYIDHIGHRLKRKEGNTDRHADLWKRQIQSQQAVDRPQDKICIFKYDKDSQITDNSQYQDTPSCISAALDHDGHRNNSTVLK